MTTRKSIFNKLFITVGIVAISTMNAFAGVNSISGIDVKQTDTNGYDILLKVDKNSEIKKYSQNPDSLTIAVNSAIPSDSLDIIYDNASDLENIIVQKKNAEDTLILLQGKNIANAKIYTKELVSGITKENGGIKNPLNNFLFLSDKNTLTSSLISIVMFLALFLTLKPKNKNVKNQNAEFYSHVRTMQNANTIRKKMSIQSKNIPSINYKINKASTSIPHDLTIKQYEEKEYVRKVG